MGKLQNYPRWWVYIVRCADGSYYTGLTHNLNHRIKQHNSGVKAGGAKYTWSHRPVQLAYFEQYSSYTETAKREIEIKKLKHHEKKLLVDKFLIKL